MIVGGCMIQPQNVNRFVAFIEIFSPLKWIFRIILESYYGKLQRNDTSQCKNKEVILNAAPVLIHTTFYLHINDIIHDSQ